MGLRYLCFMVMSLDPDHCSIEFAWLTRVTRASGVSSELARIGVLMTSFDLVGPNTTRHQPTLLWQVLHYSMLSHYYSMFSHYYSISIYYHSMFVHSYSIFTIVIQCIFICIRCIQLLFDTFAFVFNVQN